MHNEVEHFFQCPYCFQEISMLFETDVSQSYIEDCEVYCQPIRVQFETEEGVLTQFHCEAVQ